MEQIGQAKDVGERPVENILFAFWPDLDDWPNSQLRRGKSRHAGSEHTQPPPLQHFSHIGRLLTNALSLQKFQHEKSFYFLSFLFWRSVTCFHTTGWRRLSVGRCSVRKSLLSFFKKIICKKVSKYYNQSSPPNLGNFQFQEKKICLRDNIP